MRDSDRDEIINTVLGGLALGLLFILAAYAPG
jgi:hypothetical protein